MSAHATEMYRHKHNRTIYSVAASGDSEQWTTSCTNQQCRPKLPENHLRLSSTMNKTWSRITVRKENNWLPCIRTLNASLVYRSHEKSCVLPQWLESVSWRCHEFNRASLVTAHRDMLWNFAQSRTWQYWVGALLEEEEVITIRPTPIPVTFSYIENIVDRTNPKKIEQIRKPNAPICIQNTLLHRPITEA